MEYSAKFLSTVTAGSALLGHILLQKRGIMIILLDYIDRKVEAISGSMYVVEEVLPNICVSALIAE